MHLCVSVSLTQGGIHFGPCLMSQRRNESIQGRGLPGGAGGAQDACWAAEKQLLTSFKQRVYPSLFGEAESNILQVVLQVNRERRAQDARKQSENVFQFCPSSTQSPNLKRDCGPPEKFRFVVLVTVRSLWEHYNLQVWTVPAGRSFQFSL